GGGGAARGGEGPRGGRQQVGQAGRDEVEVSVDVDVEHAPPQAGVEGLGAAAAADAGVADEVADGPAALAGHAEGTHRGVGVGDVAGAGGGRTAAGGDGGAGGPEVAGGAADAEHRRHAGSAQ